jgi:hypothetical protein
MAQPMVTLVHNEMIKEKIACTMACCQKHKQTENKQAKKLPFGCCSNDMSNPFAQCCCCIGFLPEKETSGITLLSNKNILIYRNTGILISNYYSDCWRPPKAVV